MKCVAKSIALAALVLVAVGPSYAELLRSTSISSILADDEKRLLPAVMTEFYGAFDKEKGCWISSTKFGSLGPPIYRWDVDTENTVNESTTDITYCMKPIRLDVIKSTGRKMLFVVAGGNVVGAEMCFRCEGLLGLIVLTPNGANLGVVATNGLFEGYYGGYPDDASVNHSFCSFCKFPQQSVGWPENAAA
jgi:hypothetical protein